MYLGMWRLVISSFFLPLSRDSFATFLSPILSLPMSYICVPLMLLPLSGVLHSFTQDSPRHKRPHLQLLPLHPPLLLLLQRVELHLRPSWHSLCAWMLALTLSTMSCVRWTLVSVISHDDRLWWEATQWRPFLRHLRMRVMAPAMLMMLRMMMMARRVMMRCLLDILTLLSLVTKRGSSFEMRVVILIRGELV